MSDSTGDRIHPPTPRRRQEAREAGHVARSRDLATAVLLLAGLAILLYGGGSLTRHFGEFARAQFGGEAWRTADADFAVRLWGQVAGGLAGVLLPLLSLLLLVALVSHLAQIGLLWLPGKVVPDFSRLSPGRGWQRLVSGANGVHVLSGIVRVVAIVGVAAWSLYGERQRVLNLASLEAGPLAAYVLNLLLWTGIKVSGTLVALGVLDYVYQRWRYERDLQMTTEELREEMRGLRVDPVVTNRQRQLRQRVRAER